jgi:hypothetical protein
MKNELFWAWFDKVAAPKLGHREISFRKVFQHLDGIEGPVTIVETGCVRRADNWGGDGQSTILFDRYASTRPGSAVHTVDLDAGATATCAALVSSTVTVHTGDSVVVLRALARNLRAKNATIDLLYLDSFDLDAGNPVPSAVHHLKELLSIAHAGNGATLVVVDDSPSNARVIPIAEGQYTAISAPTIGGKGSTSPSTPTKWARPCRFAITRSAGPDCWAEKRSGAIDTSMAPNLAELQRGNSARQINAASARVVASAPSGCCTSAFLPCRRHARVNE